MVVSLFKRQSNLTDLEFCSNKLSRRNNIIVSLYQRAIRWRHIIGNDVTSINVTGSFEKQEAICPECSALAKPILDTVLSAPARISCTSKFDAENKYLAEVTIAMVLAFEPKRVDIDSRYYSDFKKIANFFCDCSKVMVLFEGCGFGSKVFEENPIAKLRFNNIAKYLFDNFEVSPSHFCSVNSTNFIRREDRGSDLDLQDTYQVKFLFSYQNLAESHCLVDQ